MVISKNCCNFIVLKYKDLQTIIAMITENKVTELFCMADDFCKFFDGLPEFGVIGIANGILTIYTPYV